jgi:caffeoyl-CoA O-methyltransferase
VVLELLARGIGARRVFELGSGFGYSGYWFSRAVGSSGELHLTDGDPDNEAEALRYLGQAGLEGPVTYHVGEAIEALGATQGVFDVVYCDIDKQDYPKAWEAARHRIRPGGLYICDNALAWGSATILDQAEGSDAERIRAVRAHNEAIAANQDFVTTILPIRDGVMVALRLA